MRITNMLTDALGRTIGFLPHLLAAVVILVVGLLIATALSKLTRRSLEAIRLDNRPGARRLVSREDTLRRTPNAIGRLVYWVLALVTAGLAIDALHLGWLSAGVGRVLAYLPHVIAAIVVAAIGYLVGNFVLREGERRENRVALWPRVARGAIFALAGFMALQELGIATAIVTIAFTVALSALAVAGAISFGLGNRELAGQITRDWYNQRGIGARRENEGERIIRREIGSDERFPPSQRH